MVPLARNHFGRGVAGRAAGRLKRLAGRVSVAQPEVDDLDVVEVIQKQVFGLEVSMADSALVDVFDARNNLLKELAGLLLLQLFALHDVLEELTPRCILHNEKQLSRGFNYLWPG